MATPPPNTIRNLTTATVAIPKPLPNLVIPQIPDKVVKAFPEMVAWRAQFQEAFDRWKGEVSVTLSGGTN